MSDANQVLVIGSSGKTGRRVVKRLIDNGISVRLGSRAATPAFDWEKPDTWAPALRGTSAAYVTYQPDLAVPGAVETVRGFVDVALEQGTKRLVLLSGRGEEEALAAEQVLQQSGADWTIIRASWFAQNFSESFFYDSIMAGEVSLPIEDVGEPFIDADDVAEIALAALTDPRHIGQLYEVTGPRLLTFKDAVAEIARAAGRPIAYRRIPMDEYVAMLKQYGVPAEYIGLVSYLFGTVLDGRNARMTDGVRRALGRTPRDFSVYARTTAAAGVWQVPVPAVG